ncbi:MAG: type II toxin-antitoxin system PemK/MazF family toxin [Chloroflexota bacterium]
MKQGDVYWYVFRSPDKRRPVLLLTRSSAIPFLTSVTVAPITTTIRNIPSEVLLRPDEDGVLDECVVNTDNIQTVQKANLGVFLTHLSPEKMREVREAIEFSLGFDTLML